MNDVLLLQDTSLMLWTPQYLARSLLDFFAHESSLKGNKKCFVCCSQCDIYLLHAGEGRPGL